MLLIPNNGIDSQPLYMALLLFTIIMYIHRRQNVVNTGGLRLTKPYNCIRLGLEAHQKPQTAPPLAQILGAKSTSSPHQNRFRDLIPTPMTMLLSSLHLAPAKNTLIITQRLRVGTPYSHTWNNFVTLKRVKRPYVSLHGRTVNRSAWLILLTLHWLVYLLTNTDTASVTLTVSVSDTDCLRNRGKQKQTLLQKGHCHLTLKFTTAALTSRSYELNLRTVNRCKITKKKNKLTHKPMAIVMTDMWSLMWSTTMYTFY